MENERKSAVEYLFEEILDFFGMTKQIQIKEMGSFYEVIDLYLKGFNLDDFSKIPTTFTYTALITLLCTNVPQSLIVNLKQLYNIYVEKPKETDLILMNLYDTYSHYFNKHIVNGKVSFKEIVFKHVDKEDRKRVALKLCRIAHFAGLVLGC